VYLLDASSKETLEADLQALVQSQSDVYTDALLWLASTTRDWLIIMDNADDPSLEISLFLPRCSHGHVIITTRDRHRGILAPISTHAVDGLPLEESTTLLLNTSQYEDNVATGNSREKLRRNQGACHSRWHTPGPTYEYANVSICISRHTGKAVHNFSNASSICPKTIGIQWPGQLRCRSQNSHVKLKTYLHHCHIWTLDLLHTASLRRRQSGGSGMWRTG
jgi:hypothetical protein